MLSKPWAHFLIAPSPFKWMGIELIIFGPSGFDPTAMHDQKHQHIDRAMAYVLELLLFDRAGNRPPDRLALKRLEIGHLVDAGDPKAAAHQARGGGITPQNLLRPLFEQRVQARRFPIVRTMRLQVDLTQDTLHATGTDARHNPIGDGLTSQILAGPMGNMQPLSDRLQTGQLHDLSALQRGKSQSDGPNGVPPIIIPQAQPVHSADRSAK